MILTLCGSARFEGHFHEANKQLGLAGHICFSLMTFPSVEGSKTWYTEDQKWTLDLAHFAKIQASDGVVMLNIDGYLGESSLRELKWARMQGKRIYWTLMGPRKLPEEEYAANLIDKHYHQRDWNSLISAVKEKQQQPYSDANPPRERRIGQRWTFPTPQPARRKTDYSA